jgi:L-arabinose isomerase
MANTFERFGISFRSVSGFLGDERAWTRIERWVKAAAVKRTLSRGRFGLMGHLYPGMYDVSTDLTMMPSHFGGHVEVVEFDDLRVRVNDVKPAQVDEMTDHVRQLFEITESVDSEDFEWAARVAVGMEQLVTDFSLDSLAYYHRGLEGEQHERLAAGLILGASLLTAAHVPACGEYELRTSLAMLVMDRLGAGGSFTEFQSLNFEDGVVEMGHDGPAHLAISDSKPVLRGLGVSLRFVVAEGEVVGGPLMQIGNTTSRVDFGRDPGEWCDEWSASSVAHHWALGTGHRAKELEAVCELLDIELVTV